MINYQLAEVNYSLLYSSLFRGDSVENPEKGVMFVCFMRSEDLPECDLYAVASMRSGEVYKLGSWRSCCQFWYDNGYHLGGTNFAQSNTRRV